MKINRRTFLQIGVAVAASLTGCGGGAAQNTFLTPTSDTTSSGGSASASSTTVSTATPSPSPLTTSTPPLFTSDPDLPDLTSVAEIPPTEIPDPGRFFGPDPVFAAVTPPAVSGLDTFQHTVVLMFENRSFDNLLGYLYPSGQGPNGQPFDGVGNKSLSNPIPSYAQGADRKIVPVTKATSLMQPFIDPAEEYQSMNVALFNQFNPASNQLVTDEDSMVAPFNIPPGGVTFPPPMNGFVTIFIWALVAAGKSATYDQYSTIMQCLPPNQVPVINQLASSFAVCDHWHCGVPSQTWTNRSFFNAASSSGLVDNSPTLSWVGVPVFGGGNAVPTIFDSLSTAGKTWTVYYDSADILSLTRLINYPTMKKYPFDAPYFKTMAGFYDDVEKGKLPDYAFIEPRFLAFQNDYHPDGGPSAIKRGEILLNDVYQAIRNSNSSSGSNYQNTMLVVTFDEGGTTYDHAPPPAAVPPGGGFSGQDGFNFDRLGQRIPAIIVSSYVDEGTIYNAPLDATSVIRSLEQKYGLKALSARDAASSTLAGVFNRTTPRTRDEWPRLQVRKLSADEAQANLSVPLGDVQKGIVSLAHAIRTGQNGMPPNVQTLGDAINYVQALGAL